MTDSSRSISLGDAFPELATNLRGGAGTPVNDLFDRAAILLRATGKKTHINNVPAIVTSYAYKNVELDGKALYARIATYDDRGKTPDFIVFDETPDSDNVVSANPKALMFKPNIDGEMTVFTNDGLQPVDDERYIKLAQTIVDDIAAQHAVAQQEKAATRKARKKAALDAAAGPVIVGAMLLGVFYGPQIVAWHADAWLGFIPLPQPVELIVDLANAPDHKAQGFAKPEGAAPVVVGQPITHIPLLAEYATNDVPDASYDNGWDARYAFDESRPGLYASNFDATYHPERETCRDTDIHMDIPCKPHSAVFDKDGCYVILGDYHTGATEVFTQTPDLEGKLTVRAVDTKSLKVCLTDPKDTATNGTLYVYQNH